MIKKLIFIVSVTIVFAACGGGGDDTTITGPDTQDNSRAVQIDPAKINELIESFPSPIEMAATIEDMKVPYSKKHLVPTDVANDFDSNFEKALGLGMLSADLGYLNVYNRKNAIVEYLTSIKRLADALDVDQFFEFQTLKRLATNSNNLDSLMFLSVTSYHDMDEHLRRTRRSNLSALMITGVWTEGQYLACKVNQFKSDSTTEEIIAGQKNIVKELLSVLEFFDDKPKFKKMNDQFRELLKLYDTVQIKLVEGEDKITYDQDSIQVIEPGEHTEIIYTEENLKKIENKIIKIRNNLISL
ncbi:MAG: hypothetical protein L3J56_10075 [Bacteroidales bacterium]|nr:hypothetical protein [Bacteroidales bacterium]